MPRPKRPGWSKITITLSEEIAREIRVKSSELGIEMGTFVDQTVRDHRGIPAFLDKLFAQDVKKAIKASTNIQGLADAITDHLANDGCPLDHALTPSALNSLAARWGAASRVPQPWKWAVFRALLAEDWEASAYHLNLLHGLEWFKR